MGVVLSGLELSHKIESLRKNKKVVFTNGCFDLLHVGHIRYLKQARELGDLLVVGLNSDQSVKGLKGDERPIQPENERAEILASLECVSFVTIFNDSTPLELIKKVSPHVLAKGGDWSVDKIVGADFVLSKGGEVKSLPYVANHSTTEILSKIQKL